MGVVLVSTSKLARDVAHAVGDDYYVLYPILSGAVLIVLVGLVLELRGKVKRLEHRPQSPPPPPPPGA